MERPTHGARFAFELVGVEGAEARYRVTVLSAEHEARSLAVLTTDRVELGAFEGPIEPWAEASARAFLEVVRRGFDDEAGWPRRLERWRQARG